MAEILKECPSCALDVERDAELCPYCHYEGAGGAFLEDLGHHSVIFSVFTTEYHTPGYSARQIRTYGLLSTLISVRD